MKTITDHSLDTANKFTIMLYSFYLLMFLVIGFNVGAQNIQRSLEGITKTQTLKGTTNWIELKDGLKISLEELFREH